MATINGSTIRRSERQTSGEWVPSAKCRMPSARCQMHPHARGFICGTAAPASRPKGHRLRCPDARPERPAASEAHRICPPICMKQVSVSAHTDGQAIRPTEDGRAPGTVPPSRKQGLSLPLPKPRVRHLPSTTGLLTRATCRLRAAEPTHARPQKYNWYLLGQKNRPDPRRGRT